MMAMAVSIILFSWFAIFIMGEIQSDFYVGLATGMTTASLLMYLVYEAYI